MDALYRQSTAYAEGDHTVHGQHGLMGDALAHGLADVIASGAIEGWSEGHLKKRQLHLPGQQDLRGYVCVYDLVPVNIPVSSIRLHIPDFDDEKAYMMVTLPDYLFEDKDSAVSAKGNGAGYKEFAELTENVTPVSLLGRYPSIPHRADRPTLIVCAGYQRCPCAPAGPYGYCLRRLLARKSCMANDASYLF